MHIRTRDSEEASKMPLTGVWFFTRFVLIVKMACGYIYILCDCSSKSLVFIFKGPAETGIILSKVTIQPDINTFSV
jgi:hypothetical protein